MTVIPGSRIKEVRIHLRLSQNEFSRKLGISSFTLSNYETGKRFPDSRFLLKFKELTHVDLNWLFGGEEVSSGDCPGIPDNEEITDFLYWFRKLPIVTHSALSSLELLKLKYPELFQKSQDKKN